MGGAFVGAVAALYQVAVGEPIAFRFYDPAAISRLAFPVGYRVDRLAAVMMVLVSGVGTLIFRYSTRYMYQEPGYGRFMALVALTTAVLLGMVASPNLIMLFVCWQFLSYLLYQLAHNLEHAATCQGAVRTFRVLRVGDAIFLAGILLAQFLYGTTEFGTMFERAAHDHTAFAPFPGLHLTGATAVALLVFLGAMGKSAQFPMHVWLPRSLYAPTPVHALLHAGIINACGFLINRLAPLFGQCPATLHLAFFVGLTTAILGASMMLVQNDIKRTLGFSTIGQMGYMVMECGLGAFSLAVFHLIAHGLFKAYVFLACGNVIHKARKEPTLPPGEESQGEDAIRPVTWLTGFITTLVLPLALLLVAHGVLHVPLLESQGAIIFLFFSWMTSCQAILTLVRLKAVASWKVCATMLATLLAVVFTYLFAATRFDAFLYPGAGESAAYFRAAALPGPLFESLVVLTTAAVVTSWGILYASTRGRVLRLPVRLQELKNWVYVLLANQLYLERVIGTFARPRRKRGVPRAAHPAAAGLSLAAHAAAGVMPFGLVAALGGVTQIQALNLPLAAVVLAAGWFAISWLLFEVTHGAMFPQ
ncbi:MAG: putative NADH-quinone oxidoreductase, subunit [Cyanobacteria bacterium RYN_339]|nr:putative NADH-quinone oxidoreductase, subunit [Cyanobacteria bacterium RYN_339]